ncbi:MAG: sigma-70 family RNA polymerase sigma factor [Burkholderiaceae bacterium]|nr:sigma-70 family RNA polymerase sigma factor [Burkholderiaceae bacterium]
MSASLVAPAWAGATDLAQHRAYLLRVARSRLRDAALAEDVVHDALLAALQAARAFTGRSSLRTWLTGILVHRMADAIRRDRRRGRAGHDEAPVQPVAEGADASTADDTVDRRDPQRLLEGRQALMGLQSCLQALPPSAARAVVMREVDGLGIDQIAQRLGLPPGRVSSLLHRARQRLRRCAAAHADSGFQL